MTWDRKIPFDTKGNMLSYSGPGALPIHEWRPAEPFETTLTYYKYSRGRSSALLWFKDPEGRLYPFFMADADEVIPLLQGGVIRGRFEGRKLGTNFGLTLIEHLPDETVRPS